MDKSKTELEKLEAGEIYNFSDKEVAARKDFAIVKCKEYNTIDPMDTKVDGNIFQNGLVL